MYRTRSKIASKVHFRDAWVGIFMALLAMSATATPLPSVVGEVTTVIGVSKIKQQNGDEATVHKGMYVRAGDRIDTGAAGHVHVRFVDGGLVSIRPQSRLIVESYQNAGAWGAAALKFRLEEGVMRSVTGEWGEANRDRFRLNTPVAAIGIKGTDFVVKVDKENTFASVLSGAIVMAPLEGVCINTLGPCQSGREVLLSAEMGGRMLEFLGKRGGVPRLVPAVDLLASGETHGAAKKTATEKIAVIANPVEAARPGDISGSVGTKPPDVVTQQTPVADLSPVVKPPAPPSIAVVLPEVVASPDISVPPEVVTPPEVVVPTSKPLKWLSIALKSVPDSTISKRYSQAEADGLTPAVSNFFMTLYRDEVTLGLFKPVSSQVNFKLTSASATFDRGYAGSVQENVQISDASLAVDFARLSYDTRMVLSSPGAGQNTLSSSGVVSEKGVFIDLQANQTLFGAFSNDGRQAGYAFEKKVNGGNISGLTLWGK